jgi:uncharacterized protein (UPF0333 family)
MKKGQSILEYSVLVACIVASLIALQIYFKRSFEGRLRLHADSFAQQYSPDHATGTLNISRSSSSQTTVTVQDLDDKTITDSTTTIGSNGPDTDSSIGSLQLDKLSNESLF